MPCAKDVLKVRGFQGDDRASERYHDTESTQDLIEN